MDYTIPDQTQIGHVHLKVADLERSLSFYRDLLGFTEMQRYGDGAVFISAGGYHHHIGLNTLYSKDAGPDAKYPVTGASDHGVSQALYLNDPDDNGVELYWDRPKENWPVDEKGNLQMITAQLDLKELLQLAG